MIEFIDTPAPRRLQDCEPMPPSGAQVKIIHGCAELIARAGLLPGGYALSLGCARGGPDIREKGATVLFSDGRIIVFLDMTVPPQEFAWVLLHESHHVAFALQNPDYHRQRIADAAEFQRLLEEDEARADAFAHRAIHDVALQTCIRAAVACENGAAALART